MMMFDCKRKNLRPAGRFIMSLLICLALICTPVFGGIAESGVFGPVNAYAAGSTCLELKGTNSGANDYYTYASPLYSYLTVSGSGYMRVQGYISYSDQEDPGSFDVIYYDSDFNVTSQKHIKAELPLFGAFHETDSSYYIVSGQSNYEEDDDLEVFRVTKYDKDWNRIGSCGLHGANTTVPFDAGCCRIDSYGDDLAIRTAHEMYMTSDGLNHQANVTMIVDGSQMKITYANYSISNTNSGYVSHSFNQFIKIGDGETATLDHGDALNTRALALLTYTNDLADRDVYGYTKELAHVMSFPGESGENDTGATAGGFEITGTGYLVAGSAIYQHNDKLDFNFPRDVFVTAIDNTGDYLEVGEPVWLTDVGRGREATTPQLVKINGNKFMVLWSISDEVQYVLVNGRGEPLSETYSMKGDLSDCQPIVNKGNVIWYTWGDDEDAFFEIPVDSPDKAKVTIKHSGHVWQTVSASGGVAQLRCTRCGTERTVTYPEYFYLGYSTDLYRFQYGVEKAEVSLADTVYIRGSYEDEDNEFIAFDELTLEADSENVLINNRNNTLTFTEEGTYNISAHYKYDPDTYADMTFVVSDPAHIWEFVKAENGIITYSCSHCGKTKTEGYPSEFWLGYSLDGYRYSYRHDQTTVDVGATVFFDGMYYDEEYNAHTLSDFTLETDDPANAVVLEGNSVRFEAEGSYTVTARYKYDPSVSCSMTVHALSSDHVWEFRSASNGLATFVCTDCGMTKTEEYPLIFLMGFKKVGDTSCMGYDYYKGMAIIDISDEISFNVNGYSISDFVIESERPDDCVIDNDNHTIRFKDTGWHKVSLHHKYDHSASQYMYFIVNKDLESVKLVADPAGSCAVGSEVRIDANEDGGWGYEVFTYTVTDPSGKTSELYVADMDNHDTSWFTWTPDQVGTYRFHVSVYDNTKPDIVVEDEMSYVVSAKAHETLPAAEYSIPYSEDSFDNSLLADINGWEFDADELAAKGHGLKVGEPVSITARYTLDDRDDYGLNEVTVTVVRSACEHAKTVVEGAKAATCCEEGATGDTFCTVCGELVKASVAIPVDMNNHIAIRENAAKPACPGEDGMTAGAECTACGTVIKRSEVIPGIGTIDIAAPEDNKYNGKEKTAVIEIMDRTGAMLHEGRDYLVSYENNVTPGTAEVYIEFTGKYSGEYSGSFDIVKGANPMTVKAKTVTLKYAKLKKAAQKVAVSKAMTISKRQGKASYKLASVQKSKYKKYFKVSSSSGQITVKKGLKKGTYKLKIKVTAAGNSNYNSVSKTVTVTIKVK